MKVIVLRVNCLEKSIKTYMYKTKSLNKYAKFVSLMNIINII